MSGNAVVPANQEAINAVGANPSLFNELLSSPDLDVVEGKDIAVKDSLMGVPFVVTKATFYKGINGDFVTLEIVTRDGHQLVLNDGGTGIRRQMVSYLRELGLIETGEAGPRWDNPDDKPVEFWPVSAHQDAATEGINVKLLCKRGLRKSEYEATEDRPAGTTYYLA